MKTDRMLRLMAILSGVIFLVLTLATLPTPAAAAPAHQVQKTITISGVNAVQLAWWFQHIADQNGAYWKPLSSKNKGIYWAVSLYDAAGHVGTLWESDQILPGGLFAEDKLHMQVQYMDWNTLGRGGGSGQTTPLNPILPPPADYVPPYPTPLAAPSAGGNNGFNEDMLFFNGHGFCPGRILWSWQNTANDDTPATAGQPLEVSLNCTFYLHYMEGNNLPAEMSAPGYYYTDAQIKAMWAVWEEMLTNLPNYLPDWWSEYSQDAMAREKGWTVSYIADTPLAPGVTDKMMTWRSNHCMGDDPGNCYVLWAPTAHHTVRWLPGYSPAEVLGTCKLPDNEVVVGAISPDLQGATASGLVQTGGGVMWYPISMAPIPGVYKIIKPSAGVTAAQVANFANERWPTPSSWILHQSEQVPGGLVHRSTGLRPLPLSSPVTQAQYMTDHQHLEGQFLASGFLINQYHDFLKHQHEWESECERMLGAKKKK